MLCYIENCHKKLTMTEIITCMCKCGHNYCIKHRHAESHDCMYNFKSEVDAAGFIEKNKYDKPKLNKI